MFPGQFVQKVGKRTKIGKTSVTQAITAVMISEKLRKRIQRPNIQNRARCVEGTRCFPTAGGNSNASAK